MRLGTFVAPVSDGQRITDKSGQAHVYQGSDDASMLRSLLAIIGSARCGICAVVD